MFPSSLKLGSTLEAPASDHVVRRITTHERVAAEKQKVLHLRSRVRAVWIQEKLGCINKKTYLKP
jgi:hypothetical protein